jgi:hypothetical protein
MMVLKVKIAAECDILDRILDVHLLASTVWCTEALIFLKELRKD